MGTLTYVNNFTILQVCMIVLVILFTVFEIRRWTTLGRVNKKFIGWFIARSVIMIVVFTISTLLPAMIISYFTMICVCGFGGSFYLPEPVDKKRTDWAKYKTLGIPISRDVLNQVFLWFVIDLIAYVVWVRILPQLLSKVFPDQILFERLF